MKSQFTQPRKHLRVAWRIPARIQALRDQLVYAAVTRNLSSHGAFLFCDAEIAVGTPVMVSFDPRLIGARPDDAPRGPLRIKGRVTRSGQGDERTLAVTFESLADGQEQWLRAAVFERAMHLMERISEFPAFWNLTELDQLALTTVCHEVRLAAGESLVRLGDEATSVFLVKSGRVQLRTPYPAPGQSAEVEVAHAGQVFGEVAALLDLPHNLDIIALVETELLAMPRESILSLRDHNPNLAVSLYEIFAHFMGRRLRKLTSRLYSPLSC
jgi:CRP-like cAMP-binding protein